MRPISKATVLALHQAVIEQTGGADGLRDEGSLDSALAQPSMSFGGQDLYPTLLEKAAALCFSLVGNHPFVDGNKRIGFVATDALLRANGLRIDTTVEEGEPMFLTLAAGEVSREELLEWLTEHTAKHP